MKSRKLEYKMIQDLPKITEKMSDRTNSFLGDSYYFDTG